MINQEFKFLIKKRINFVKSVRENQFLIDELLSGLYNDPSHFIYEILQNAEDAGATEIHFNLEHDKIVIKHNARHDFNFQDVDAITGIGNTTKAEDFNQIGKFGVGFKSVFAVSKTPIIHSGKFHFQINDFVVPLAIENNNCNGTTIILPFNHPQKTREDVYNLVENKLNNIGLKTLLFLRNINSIVWNSNESGGQYNKNIQNITGIKSAKYTSIQSNDNLDENIEKYLVIDKVIKINDKNLKIEIAYRIEKDKNDIEQIVPISDSESKLVVYFPTEKVTYLNFLIQGPFITTPNRENIPLENKKNELIIEGIGDLVASSLTIIKKIGLLNSDFLEILPIEDDRPEESIYSSIFNKIKEKLLSGENLLPTNHGGFSNNNNSLLANSYKLTKLLNQKDIKLLFGKAHWLDTSITPYQRSELRSYLLNEIGIEDINFEKFSNCINKPFMKSKDDKWILKFYCELIGKDKLFRDQIGWQEEGVLRLKPIIRLKNNNHCSPFDSAGKIQVYLPTKVKTSYQTVKTTIVENKTAKIFLDSLGIEEPDIIAEINETVLPKYIKGNKSIKTSEYLIDLSKLMLAVSNQKSSIKVDKLLADLQDISLIKSINNSSREIKLLKPNEVYIRTNDLKLYFKGQKDIYFIDESLYKRFNKNDLNSFAEKIRCNSHPRRIQFERKLSWEEKSEILKNESYSYTRDISILDFKIEGLKNCLRNITKEKSYLIWKWLLIGIQNYPGYTKDRFFKGIYKWTPQSVVRTTYFNSMFLKQLKGYNWINDNNNNYVRTNLVSIREIDNSYNTTDENVSLLIEVLEFKLDQIKEIEKKTGGLFIPKEHIDPYKQWLEEQENINDETEYETDLHEEIDSLDNNYKVAVEIVEPEIMLGDDLTNQRQTPSENTLMPIETNTVETDNINRLGQSSDTNIIEIGERGEKIVYNYLLNDRFSNKTDVVFTNDGFRFNADKNEKYQVRWLNVNGKVGKGYDFVISLNGKEIEYIEVKTTKKSGKSLHTITGTQWQFASDLFKKGQGEKYFIYVVKSAYTADPILLKIENPIKLWKDGKLYAHPIQFKI